MDIDLSEEAREYGRTVQRALEAAGGDALVQQAEENPDTRAALVEPVLAELGAWDLDPRGSIDELEAAASLCRSAGYWSIAYPVAERIAGVIVLGNGTPAARVAGLDAEWSTITLDGARGRATARPLAQPPRKAMFVTELDVVPADSGVDSDADLALGLVLPCWTLLGMLDRAVELTCAYVREREQFGQPLAQFQGVQFQLTDAEVEHVGLAELAKYALWSIEAGLEQAVDDALVLRLAALEAAEVVFRVAHQLHGAIGFCDETTVSWLSRYSQPVRRLPLGLSATRDALTSRVGGRGLAGLFG